MELTMTFQGLLAWDPNLFSTFSLPAGVTLQDVVEGVLLYSSDRCVLWPDPDAMKGALAAWSALQVPGWSKMAAALTASYDPLENYDRHEEGGWKDQRGGKLTNSGTDTRETSVSAYDSSVYEPRAKEEFKPTTATEDTTSTERTFQQYRVHGNIGVTTSQQMLEAEMQLRQAYASIADLIAKQTVEEFTFGVY